MIADGDEQRIADALLLDDSILDGAWTAMPRTDDDDPETDALMQSLAPTIDVCSAIIDAGLLDGDDFGILQPADIRSESPSYSRGRDEVEFTASVFDSVDQASATFAEVTRLQTTECFSQLLPAFVQAGLDESGIDASVVGRILDIELTGDDTWAFPLALDMTSGGEDVGTLGIEWYAIRRDRAVVSASVSLASGEPVDTAAIVAAMEERILQVLPG